MRPRAHPILILAAATACGPRPRPPSEDAVRSVPVDSLLAEAARRILTPALERTGAMADSVEDALQPVPLMRPAQEARLRRFGNVEHLARARALGVRPRDSAQVEALLREGRLVSLEDSTEYWVIRDLDYSRPIVTPDTRALLEEIGRGFQARLEELGLPGLRLEVTSALRTAESQEALREENANAARGVSTHEFGTTIDIAYSGYAAPAELPGLEAAEGSPLGAVVHALAAARIEAAAAEKSRELEAILGEVLTDLQDEGVVLVTLERLQPVYHLTVARRSTGG